jgi:tetratricopeptide (TPR) repeat protein
MSDMQSPAINPNTGNCIGIAAATKYNPHLWSSEELRAIFVARKRELETILQVVKSADATVAPQHMLITGQRGMGKSTLLQRVALAVEDDPGLHKTWLPLRFPEEQYTVSSPAELWANVIGAVADALESQGQPTLDIDTELARLMDLPKEQRETASLGWLNQWCANHHRRLLLLIDSTDLLFSNLAGSDANKRSTQQDGGASSLWRVRRALLHSPNLLWLGGSYQPLEANGLYSDAFLDFFQLIELRPLTLGEMQSAILAMANRFGAGRGLRGDEAEAEVLNMLNRRPERLRAMRQLTGGNPRTTVMLYELFAAGGRDNVRADLERLLDAMTPLYKARLEVLADQPRKVLAHVMEHWAPITAKALAKAASLTVSTVSAQLSRLEQEGLVSKTALSGTKRQGYQCSERFFNIWYLMRNAPRGARARVGWLVEFMRLWYSGDELQDIARTRWGRHRDGLLCDVPELEYSRALARTLPDDAQNRRQLEWSVFQQTRKGPAYKEIFELDGDDANYLTPDAYLTRFEALQNDLVKAPLTSDERLVWAQEVKRALHLTISEKESLAKGSERMSASELAQTRLSLSESRESLIKNHDRTSFEQVERAVADGSFFPDCPDSRLALTQLTACFEAHPDAFAVAVGRLADRRTDAHVETACKEAIFLARTSARPLNTYARLLNKLNRPEEAEVAYRKAIEIDPKWDGYWASLGNLLANRLNRLDEAEAAYRKAIEIDPKWNGYWICLGDLLANRLNRLDEAEAAYRQAIEIDPKWPVAWNSLGDLLANRLNRLDEAEATYRQAIEIDPKRPAVWNSLGDLLANRLNRLDEAEAAYRQAIEIDPKWSGHWGALGDLLSRQPNRLSEAEAAYRNAIRIDPKLANAWERLGKLLGTRLNRIGEAEAAIRRAIELDSKQPDFRTSLGNLLQDKCKRYGDAEKAYSEAIALQPTNVISIANLARLYATVGRKNEADTQFREVLKMAKDDDESVRLQAHCWLGNSDLAMQSLDKLAELAAKSEANAFYLLKEQCFECHAMGLSGQLADLMQRSRFADFLMPLALALRAANGEKDALLDSAVEVKSLAEEVLAQIRGVR